MNGTSAQGAADGGDREEKGAPPVPPWLRQLCVAASALRELARAQWQLMGAEWRLARSAAMTALLASLLIVVFAVALGLTVLVLAGVLLAHWLNSWILALVILGVVLALCLAGSIVLFRRCLVWMSLPETRAQWHLLARDLGRPERTSTRAAGEAEAHETASSTD